MYFFFYLEVTNLKKKFNNHEVLLISRYMQLNL